MSGYRLPALAAAAALSLAALPAAAAGCCPEPYNNCPCAPTVPLEPYDITGAIYVVNQGPVFSGPVPVPRQWADPELYGQSVRRLRVQRLSLRAAAQRRLCARLLQPECRLSLRGKLPLCRMRRAAFFAPSATCRMVRLT